MVLEERRSAASAGSQGMIGVIDTEPLGGGETFTSGLGCRRDRACQRTRLDRNRRTWCGVGFLCCCSAFGSHHRSLPRTPPVYTTHRAIFFLSTVAFMGASLERSRGAHETRTQGPRRDRADPSDEVMVPCGRAVKTQAVQRHRRWIPVCCRRTVEGTKHWSRHVWRVWRARPLGIGSSVRSVNPKSTNGGTECRTTQR